MMPLDLKTLYSLVTEAIRKSEVLAELNAPGARAAYLDVSLLEERIASLLPASDDEGAIARRGAVAAATDAHEFTRAQQLVARFLAEDGVDSSLRANLTDLQAEASAMADRVSRPAEQLVRGAEVMQGSKAFIAEVLQGSAELTGAAADRTAGDLMDAIVEHLRKEGKFTLPSFGTFTVCATKARKGLNPRTGEAIKVKASETVRFKPSPTLKEAVSSKDAVSSTLKKAG
jgi:DNA-binding protein HU-beta